MRGNKIKKCKTWALFRLFEKHLSFVSCWRPPVMSAGDNIVLEGKKQKENNGRRVSTRIKFTRLFALSSSSQLQCKTQTRTNKHRQRLEQIKASFLSRLFNPLYVGIRYEFQDRRVFINLRRKTSTQCSQCNKNKYTVTKQNKTTEINKKIK